MEAWNRYLCARLAHDPTMGLPLAKYQIITMLFQHYAPLACIEYDKLFRQTASRNPAARWDCLKDDIFVWALTLSTFTHPRPNTLPPSQQAQALGEQPPFCGHEQYPLRTQSDRIPDFFLAGPPDSPRCGEQLYRFLQIAAALGVQVAMEKVDGPATVLVFLGLILDRRSVCPQKSCRTCFKNSPYG